MPGHWDRGRVLRAAKIKCGRGGLHARAGFSRSLLLFSEIRLCFCSGTAPLHFALRTATFIIDLHCAALNLLPITPRLRFSGRLQNRSPPFRPSALSSSAAVSLFSRRESHPLIRRMQCIWSNTDALPLLSLSAHGARGRRFERGRSVNGAPASDCRGDADGNGRCAGVRPLFPSCVGS